MSTTDRQSGRQPRMRRLAAIAAAGVLLSGVAGATAPTPASAGTGKASGFADFGKFKCKRVSTGDDSIHTDCRVTDTKKDDKGVYLQVKGIRDNNWDTDWWRHSRNVRPGYPATNHLKSDSYAESDSVDRWRIRVCKEVKGTDPCSGYDTVGV